MKLTILGGGGFRVPLVYDALRRENNPGVDEVVLYDLEPTRLTIIAAVLRQLANTSDSAPGVRTTSDLDDALSGADFVFSAIRVGGLAGRTLDERIALDAGVLGQETTGPGGIAYGLRTVPVALDIAARVAACCPDAWVINFTNPAGMVTEAMQQVLGERVIGICDSPVALGRRAARALQIDPATTTIDYAGLNHLGWLRRLIHDGTDLLPSLLSDDAALLGIEEGRLFGVDWLQQLGMIPNEYLYYYYFNREAVAGIRGAADTRGEFLLRQQEAFYAAAAGDREHALREWQRVRRERDATYLAESRREAQDRDPADVDGGGYEAVALELMVALAGGPPATLILNVRNGNVLRGLPSEGVVEVPCAVDETGPHPLATPSLTGHPLGLVQQVKAVEQLTIRAAVTGSRRTAWAALALHPLVDSVTTAKVLLEGYCARIPALAAVFD